MTSVFRALFGAKYKENTNNITNRHTIRGYELNKLPHKANANANANANAKANANAISLLTNMVNHLNESTTNYYPSQHNKQGVKMIKKKYNIVKLCDTDYRDNFPFKLTLNSSLTVKDIKYLCELFYKTIIHNISDDPLHVLSVDFLQKRSSRIYYNALIEIYVNYLMYMYFTKGQFLDLIDKLIAEKNIPGGWKIKVYDLYINILKDNIDTIIKAYPKFGKILENKLRSIEKNKQNKKNKAELNRQIALYQRREAQKEEDIAYIDYIPRKYKEIQNEYISRLTRRIAYLNTLNETKLRELYTNNTNANIESKLEMIKEYIQKYELLVSTLKNSLTQQTSGNNSGNVRGKNSGNVNRNNSRRDKI